MTTALHAFVVVVQYQLAPEGSGKQCKRGILEKARPMAGDGHVAFMRAEYYQLTEYGNQRG